jgi:RNA polymerase sigma-70 factor (ECF subfamily)
VWRVLRHLGIAACDLEDTMQEVFMVVHRRIGEYREEEKIKAWLYAIAARVAKDYRRRLGRRREHLTDAPPEESHGPTQAADVESQQALRVMERLILDLPEKQRAVFVLYEIEQMSMSEVALMVGCPLQTAYARLHKARERLVAQASRADLLGDAP